MLTDIALGIISTVTLGAAVVYIVIFLRGRRHRRTSCQSVVERFLRPRDPQQMVTVSRVFPSRVRADLQLSLNEALTSAGTVSGFSGMRQEYAHMGIEFNSFFSSQHVAAYTAAPQYEEVDVGGESPVRCMNNGLWLIQRNGVKLVVLMAPAEKFGQNTGVRVEVACPPGEENLRIVETILKSVEDGIARAGSYRGKVLSLEKSDSYSGQSRGITVHRLRGVSRNDIILPGHTLELLDRNIVRFIEQRSKLVERGMSAKKGVLFYGPPGTGKTHMIHYMVEALKGHTFLLITAEQQGLIGEYITLARLLQPSVVVIEDADLIATNRNDEENVCVESLLNKLLNEMDGLRSDAQILFVLTTNRPEALEPALAARPGRVDQAIEFPLPDSACRARLVSLYASRTRLEPNLTEKIVDRTKGVSAAFIKEFIRRAVQHSLEHGRNDIVSEADVESALQEMLHDSGPLTPRFTGAASTN